MNRTRLWVTIAFTAAAALAGPAPAPAQPQQPSQSKAAKIAAMDYGPMLTTSVFRKTPSEKMELIALKGMTIRLPGDRPAAVCFDTDLMCVAAAWTGGFLDLADTMLTNHKATGNATIQGDEIFSASGPGWAGADGFDDPRPTRLGPLPADHARYRGMYRDGQNVVLAYTVGGSDVLELPSLETGNAGDIIARTLHIEPSTRPLKLLVCDVDPTASTSTTTLAAGSAVAVTAHDSITATALVAGPETARLEIAGHRLILTLPIIEQATRFKVLVWRGPPHKLADFHAHASRSPAPRDLAAHCKGGPPLWSPPLITQGTRSADDAPYVVDTLTLPEDNPWNAWLRTSGVDFFSDGRAAISTFNGDVWIVSGIDDDLQTIRWKRFAAGLYEPLGLRIVDDRIYVRARDQITRLHDLNNDGEADFYENFNNDGVVNPSYHGFAHELQTDSRGNFYYGRPGHRAPVGYPLHGCIFRIAPDGSTHEIFATGVRAPNGLGIGPDDQIAFADNQGEWIPSSKIHLLRQGDFLGFTPHHHLPAKPTSFADPLCWLPMEIDSSGGTPVWITSDRWGPYNGQIAHTSFGRASLILVLIERTAGREQASLFRLPLKFDTGIMRGRFHPRDGQLYVCGIGGGWQSGGVRDGGLYRVRYTGKPIYFPIDVRTQSNGLRFTFAQRLDPATASDEQNYAVERWNYRWSEAYGSPDYSVENPARKGRDPVDVGSATLSDDRLTLFLEIPDIKPVMQMMTTFNIKAADGADISLDVYHTINHVPPASR